MNETNHNLTDEESRLIMALLDLYDSMASDLDHPYRCKCPICEAIDIAGNHHYATFTALREKLTCKK